MASQKFDLKSFNPEAFGGYVESIPQMQRDELIKSRVLTPSERIKNLLGTQTGSFYGTITLFGSIDGEPDNYDGSTDITTSNMDTYEQSVIAVGRAHGWTERDFSTDITSGVNFMDEVGKQVSKYWDGVNTGLVMSIIKGIFSMTTASEKKFVEAHTHDVGAEGDGKLQPTTLNTAMQKACGDAKSKFSLVFMHSAVATNLENQNLLEFLKYTDANGIQRPLPLASWNGRLVVVDDGMPTQDGYYDAEQGDVGALQVKASGASGAQVNKADVEKAYFGSKASVTADTDYVVKGVRYTTYVFGEGAIEYADLGAEVPFEMARDPYKNGGQTTLINRMRKCIAPRYISFTKKSVSKLSPTNAELENGANWALVHNGAGKVVDHKAIAIARVFSRG